MSRHTQTIGADYFEALYRADPDPWRFASSVYEREKYAATLAALPPRRFRSGFEIGCSIGVLTNQLGALCDELLAVDVADTALEQARRNCTLSNVSFANMRVPDAWPDDRKFELIVLSEVLYYLVPDDIVRVAAKVAGSVAPAGIVLLVHYLGGTNYPVSGDEAASLFIAKVGLHLGMQRRTPDYRIDVLGSEDPLASVTRR